MPYAPSALLGILASKLLLYLGQRPARLGYDLRVWRQQQKPEEARDVINVHPETQRCCELRALAPVQRTQSCQRTALLQEVAVQLYATDTSALFRVRFYKLRPPFVEVS
jgi:hypothetical protein